MLTFMFYCLFS